MELDNMHLPFVPSSSASTPQLELPHRPRKEVLHYTMAGHCTSVFKSGIVSAPCPCLFGTFDISSANALSNCTTCLHPLSLHKDPHGSPQRSISPPDHAPCSADRLIFDRKETVAALWERIKYTGVVHIRGTPSSGKSTLAALLAEYVQRRRPQMRVYSITWPATPLKNWDTAFAYNRLLNDLTNRPHWSNDWLSMRALLVIDEAQETYRYMSLWNDLIKGIYHHTRIQIALFSSYGSPTDAPLGKMRTPTPILLTSLQRISIRRTGGESDIGLFYSRDEFNRAVSMKCEYESKYRKFFGLSPELTDYIWEFTLGQPAVLNDILCALSRFDPVEIIRKEKRVISLDIGLELLNNDRKFLSLIQLGTSGFCRSLPTRAEMEQNPAITQFLRELLVANRSEDDLDENVALRDCYLRGWVHAEESDQAKPVYILPSPVHRRYLECMLSMDAPESPLDKYTCVRDLCFAAIRRFNPLALRCPHRGLSVAANPRPVEAQYQDEFYRACYSVLGNSIHLSTEWTGKKLGGRVDFLVKSVGWAIECLRDGDRIEEHISRFHEGGRYHKWIETAEIKQYILLDFRTSVPQKPRDDDHLYSVVFNEDYTTYKIYDAKGYIVEQEISLLC
ncbi:hypothetical protein DTO212C5_7573 [Paecilomyces variotii]|nr:hypothetical protein DTO212C5_7573 [Paecilomyces variotii]